MLYRAVRLVYCFCYARYLLASALALGVDLTCFFLMLKMAVPALIASTLGYSTGLAIHWLLSSRLVFVEKSRTGVAPSITQKLQFAASALVGLVITAVTVQGGLRLGVDPGIAKLLAVGMAFQTTYLLRRHLIFS